MFENLKSYFDTSGFMPHGHCYLWSPALVSINLISDSIIFASYLAISITLVYTVMKVKEIPFQNIYLAFGTFIVACGFTHFMEIINIWNPEYWITAGVKIVTALASLGTAACLPFLFPKVRDLAKGAELLKTQAALRESERLYRQIVDTANEGIWMFDLDGRTRFVNKRMAEMLGRTVEELNRSSLSDHVDAESGSLFQKHVQSMVLGRSTEPLELAMYPKGGSQIFVRLLCNSIPNNQGEIVGTLAMVTDITKKREAIRKLQTSELHFRSLIESLPQLVWSGSSSGETYFMNGNLREKLPQHGGNIIDDLLTLLHPEDLRPTQKIWEEAFVNETFVEGEFRVRSPDGSYRWKLGRMTPIRNPDHTIGRWVAISTDIHEQKEAQRVILESQSRLKAALHHMDAFLWAVDPNLIVTASEGNAPKDVFKSGVIKVGESVLQYFEPTAEVVEFLRHGLRGHAGVMERAAPGGIFRELRINPLRNEDGQVTGVVGVSFDITDRKKAVIREEAAIESSRLKSEFLANMSHEIRTPLNGVLGMMKLLNDSKLTDEQKEMVHNAKKSGEVLLTILNDILDFSKIEAGKLEFESVDFNLPELILESQKMITYAAEEKNVVIEVDMDKELPTFVRGDPARLRQILWNLMANAIKFTHRGFIRLNVRKMPSSENRERLHFEVVDTGIGIPLDAQKNLFKAFNQADSSTTRRFGGTGLGLSIAKTLVEKMSGRIGVESIVGEGSRFWFTVSLGSGTPVEENAETEFSLVTAFHEAKVLIADDNAINRMVVLRFLVSMGYQAEAVNNGKEVIEALQNKAFDLILMDCHMPEMDGFECTKVIRETRLGYSDIPIVALTASAMKRDYERCLEVGMNDFVAKPIRQKALFDAMERQLSFTHAAKPPSHSRLKATEMSDSF